jgi:prepilin-type N-terminal cleavage/methylation domain-containing protein/prepilin-type processing-associated H-X9-DG protein
MRSHKKGFTLIELLVVISIIALLLSIMMPGLSRAKELAKRTVCASNLKSIGTSVFVYANKNNDQLPPTSYQPGDDDYSDLKAGDPYLTFMLFYLKPSVSPSMRPKDRVQYTYGLGHLFMSDILEDGESFYCPSAPKALDNGNGMLSFHYGDYSNNGTTFPWNNEITNPTGSLNKLNVRSSYNYIPQNAKKLVAITGRQTEYFPDVAEKSYQLNSRSVLACDFLYSKEFLPHKKGSRQPAGVNVLHADGSVAFNNDEDAFADSIWNPDIADYDLRVGNDEYAFRKVIRLME